MSTAVLPAHRSLAATAQRMAENWLRNVFSPDLYTVRGREAKDAAAAHDIEVVRAHPKTDADRAPVLVVEIEDADTAYDLAEQASRNAAEGVPEYWVLDVIARKLHIFRNPQPDPDAAHGVAYKLARACGPNALVAPQIAELHLAQVVDLLPRE
jgi:Uma2 family endonuclease